MPRSLGKVHRGLACNDRLLQATCVHSSGRPILRWAGGKSHLIPSLLKLLPDSWHRYVEPMVGGGALFFHLAPPRALLADINDELMNFYRVLRDHPDDLITRLMELKPSRKIYYLLRNQEYKGQLDRAIRFAYLNRLCWNGLFRVNKQGRFNVPIGDRLPRYLWSENDLRRAATALGTAQLLTADFSETLKQVRKGDLVFIDPPYPRGAKRDLGFNRYSSSVFSLQHHEKLGKLIRAISTSGARVIITLSHSPKITGRYPKALREFKVISKTLISSKSTTRGHVREAVLLNYLPKYQVDRSLSHA